MNKSTYAKKVLILVIWYLNIFKIKEILSNNSKRISCVLADSVLDLIVVKKKDFDELLRGILG